MSFNISAVVFTFSLDDQFFFFASSSDVALDEGEKLTHRCSSSLWVGNEWLSPCHVEKNVHTSATSQSCVCKWFGPSSPSPVCLLGSETDDLIEWARSSHLSLIALTNGQPLEENERDYSQVIHPSPEPAGMTSFLAVSLPPDSCPDKTGEFLSVPIGSRKVRLETDWKVTGIVRKHPTGTRRQRTSQKRLGNGRKRRKPAGSDMEIAGTGRPF